MAPDWNGRADRIAVLLDANALMGQVTFRMDIFEALRNLIGAYEPVVLADVMDELRGLTRGQGKDGSAARAALILAERCRIVASDLEEGTVDEKIVHYASTHECMVCTNDRALRNSLLSLGIPVISQKGRKKLDIIRK